MRQLQVIIRGVGKSLLTATVGLAVAAGVALSTTTPKGFAGVIIGADIALVSAVLPTSRSVSVGTNATAFATIINSGTDAGTQCLITPITTLPANFFYQTTNPATNAPVGLVNTPVAIGAGASQTFVFGFTPTTAFAPVDVQLRFGCDNADNDAPVLTGINTLLLSASDTPVPDIVALSATVDSDGVVDIPSTTGTGFFTLATINVGATDNLLVSVDTGGAALPLTAVICETHPVTSTCINPTVPTAAPVSIHIPHDATPTFAVFVTGTGDITLDPAQKRIFVRFRDSSDITRGSTSVAVETNGIVAALSVPASELANVSVTLDASASHDAFGTIVQYAFDFGDGSAPQLLASPTVTHSYAAPGTYLARVTLTDDRGRSDSATASVVIGIKRGAAVNISKTTHISQSANAFRESGGAIDVVWEEYGVDLLFARSIDGGQTFTAPKYLIDPDSVWGSNNDYAAAQLKVIEAGGTIHVVATIFDLLFGGAEIFHLRSTDSGVTFGDPLFVSANDGINSIAAAVDAEGDGTVSMAWQNADLDTGEDSISYSHSIDDGVTFSVPVTVSALPGYAGCSQVLWSANDALMLWTTEASGTFQILAARTVDHGSTFSTPIDVDRNPAKSWCANAVRDPSGAVYAVWEEGDAFADTRIVFALSTDRGVSVGTPVTLSAPGQIAICPSIEVGDGLLVVTWTAQVNSTLGDSFLTTSTDNGTTFATPLKIPSGPRVGGCYQVIARDAASVGLISHEAPAPGEWSDIFYTRVDLSVP